MHRCCGAAAGIVTGPLASSPRSHTLPRVRQGLDAGSEPRTIVVLPLVEFSRMKGGGRHTLTSKFHQATRLEQKLLAPARLAATHHNCDHNLLNQHPKREIFHSITTAADAGATAECQNSESASLARRSNCLVAEAVVEGDLAEVEAIDVDVSCKGGGGGVSKT